MKNTAVISNTKFLKTMRNKCLTIRTTEEVSKTLERYEDYMFQKGTVAHTILERVLTDLNPDDLKRILCRYPQKGLKLELIEN